MADVFTQSGDLTNVGTPAPVLQGAYIPAIDNPELLDGFGMVIPWGGGNTTRRIDYGLPSEPSPANRLMDLWPTNDITYKFAGLDGPQGPPGPPGPRGFPGASATGVTSDPATHNLAQSTTAGSTGTLQVAGSETELESITTTSRGNAVEISAFATFVSTGAERVVTIRIYDTTGGASLFSTPFTLSAGATQFQDVITVHTPGVQSNTYTFDASVDVDGADVTVNTRGISTFESFI